MTIIRTALKRQRPTAATYVLEPLGVGSPVRVLYLEQDAFPDDIPEYVAVRIVLDDDGAMTRFAQFLEDRIEIGDSTYKLTIGQMWSAWAGMHGADVEERETAGIKRADVPDLFMDRFGADEMTRAKIDGRTQRCWRGYRIADGTSKK